MSESMGMKGKSQHCLLSLSCVITKLTYEAHELFLKKTRLC